MDYNKKAEEVKDAVLSYLDGGHLEWHQVKKTKDAVVEKAVSPVAQGHLFKGEFMLDYAPEDVFPLLDVTQQDPKNKTEKDVKERKIVRTIEENVLWIVHSMTHSAGMGLISPREFVDLVTRIVNDKYLATFATSIEYPDVPTSSKFVRGFNHPSGRICFRVPGEPNKTRCVLFIHADAAGSLPISVVERFMPSIITDTHASVCHLLKEAKK